MAARFGQSFPHGRTKTVTVELKKKRTYTQGAGGKMTEVPHEAEAEARPFDAGTGGRGR